MGDSDWVQPQKLEDLGLELETLKDPRELLFVWPVVLDAHNYGWYSKNHQCLGPTQTQKLRILRARHGHQWFVKAPHGLLKVQLGLNGPEGCQYPEVRVPSLGCILHAAPAASCLMVGDT